MRSEMQTLESGDLLDEGADQQPFFVAEHGAAVRIYYRTVGRQIERQYVLSDDLGAGRRAPDELP